MSAGSTNATSSESGRTLASYHPLDPDVQADPWHYYSLLRREAPVHRDPHTGLFIVSSYERATEVLKNWKLFSNRFARAMGGDATGAMSSAPIAKDGFEHGWRPVDTMLTADPPEQKRFRSLVDGAFRMKRVRALESRIRDLCDGLIDAFIDRGSVELRAEFAVPVPLTIIAEQLGVPRDELPQFKRWSDGFVKQLGGMASPEEQRESARLILEFQRYFSKIIEARRAEPRDDIISDMVNAEVAGERSLDIAESLSILQQLLVAGNETTASSICEGMRLFSENPAELAKVRADPGLIPNAVEEIVRLATPTASMWRVATEASELGGVEIPAGAMLLVRFAAANRDEAVFDEPDRFDVERSNARDQIGFGLGLHYCIGAQLAKAELRCSMQALTSRLHGVRLAADAPALRYPPNILLRGLEALHLEFDSGR
jgi:cytochrome P450